jgi:heme A synthase
VRRLAGVAAAATLALIALGGVVRVTGSGMGCGDDWPLCHGRLLPPLDLPTIIEYGHRVAAAAVGALVLALAAAAWRTRHPARGPASAAAVLLVAQVLIGAVTVRLRLPAWTVVLHLATAMLLLAALLAAALAGSRRGGVPGAVRGGGPARWAPGGRAAAAAAALGFVVVLAGGLVANLHAGAACHGFPLCSGSWLPPGGRLAGIHWAHRALAFALVALLAAGSVRAAPGARGPWAAALGAAVLQVGLAAAMVLAALPPGLRAAHAALGAVVWAGVVVVALRGNGAISPATAAPLPGGAGARGARGARLRRTDAARGAAAPAASLARPGREGGR